MDNRAKDLVGLDGMAREDIEAILNRAANYKADIHGTPKKSEELIGRTTGLLFFEASTRTTIAFEQAAHKLQSDVITLASASKSSVSKGETLLDTARNIRALGVDVLVVRHKSAGAPMQLAEKLDCGVINAGDGCHEHPTQALLDMFTLREHFGRLEGLKVAILGDIMHSRVARSNAIGLTTMGAEVTFIAPSPWLLTDGNIGARSISTLAGIEQYDCLMTLRIQNERLGNDPGPTGNAYAAEFGLTEEIMKRTKPECVIMHPGPINKGVEVTSELADDQRYSLILKQVANGVYVRMAVLARSIEAVSGE